MVRLKHPSLSPDRESAPHWRTTALGWYISMTLAIICTRSNVGLAQKKGKLVSEYYRGERSVYSQV